MISFKTISSFRSRLSGLLSVRRKVYVNVENEIKREFAGKPIEQIRQNSDMILLEGDSIIIKLRLPDKKQHLSRKDGYRLIYLVSKTDEIVVFLDIYPKNGPLQQLDIADAELKFLVKQFIDEAQLDMYSKFELDGASYQYVKNVMRLSWSVCYREATLQQTRQILERCLYE